MNFIWSLLHGGSNPVPSVLNENINYNAEKEFVKLFTALR